MARRRVSNPLALAVLSCLHERPMHPYEISTTLRSRGKEQSIRLNYGSLYSVVESLQRHGLVSPLETTREGRRPERTVYEITDAGVHELEDWLSELLSTPARDHSSLEAGLSLMPGLPPDDVATLLETRCDRLRIEVRSLDATLDVTTEMGLPDLFVVEVAYRRRMLTAELGFVADLAGRIRDGSFPGVKAWRRLHELHAEGVPLADIFADPVGRLGPDAAAFDTAATQTPRRT